MFQNGKTLSLSQSEIWLGHLYRGHGRLIKQSSDIRNYWKSMGFQLKKKIKISSEYEQYVLVPVYRRKLAAADLNCFFVDWILCAWLPLFATFAFLASGYHVDWICNSTEARNWIHCSSRLVHHLATGCISTAAGCPVVGREKLATGFPNDWMRSNSWFIVAHAWEYCCYLLVSLRRSTCWFLAQNHLLNLTKAKRCRINLFERHRFAIANFKFPRLLLYRSSSNLRLFSASVPAGPFAPADLSSSAEHDVDIDYIIVDGPLRCSSWFSFDVPADPSSSSSACSWFISFQLIHYAPAGSTWPPPDFEHLT
ncbi:pentatricopeptide repeat-containing protein-like [Dorcoceras hygrometricum]|uniref:Pentatricopeptide repeat-containing protein-like n=1 Tax=Dorcoceras hygrometricum TaxID=472368 RepID=A0A2Z7B747_9LAMI|nr:pentatricopeptide repeat-containing protein-like [Dorcoceras hygrometricum]